MSNEVITNLNLCLNIGLIFIICNAIGKGYRSKSTEYENNINYANNETHKLDEDIGEVMSFVRLFTGFLFTTSFLMVYYYGVNLKIPVDPIIMKMFLWGAVLYLGHDIVWLLVGLLWFAGSATHVLLTEIHKPPTPQ
jgi:hypothetical protein